MEQVPTAGPNDIQVEKFGAFHPTGIDGKDIAWVDAAKDKTGQGAVHITFTPAGTDAFAQLLSTGSGKTIGIFMRGVPVSISTLTAQNAKDSLTILHIPSPEIAFAFRDDALVNLFLDLHPLH
jgi:preprotein translocase subunit SecD